MFIKRTIVYTIGDLLAKISPFILIPILTRTFGAKDYTYYANFLLMSNMLQVFISGWALSYLYIVFFKSKTKFKYIFSIVSYISFSSLMLSIFLFLIAKNMDINDYITFTLLSLIGASSLTLNLLYTTVKQIEGNAFHFSIYNIGKSFLFLILSIILINFFDKTTVYDVIYCNVIVNIIYGFGGLFEFYVKKYYKPFVLKLFVTSFKYGYPLIPNMTIGYIKSAIDRFSLFTFLTISIVGAYTASFQLLSSLILISNAIVRSISPELMMQLKNNNKVKIKYILKNYIKIVGGCSILINVFLFYFSTAILGDEFHYSKYFSFLSYSLFFLSLGSLFTCYYQFYEKTKLLMSLTILNILIHAVMVLIFSCFFGVIGFIVASIIASILSTLILYFKGFINVV